MQQIQMVDAVCFITVTCINKNGHPEPGRVEVMLRKMCENILANPALVMYTKAVANFDPAFSSKSTLCDW